MNLPIMECSRFRSGTDPRPRFCTSWTPSQRSYNTVYDVAVDHERRYAVGKSTVDHEITRIGNHCRMKARDIAHQIIETVSCNFSGCIEVDSIKTIHDICVIGISKSGTTGSPNFSISTLQLSSFPIGTDGSMMFGITIMIFVTFSCNSFSVSSNSARRAALALTCAFTA